MKKILTSVIVCSLFVGMATTVSATNDTGMSNSKYQAEYQAELKQAEYYAYMDLDTAPESLKHDILEARNKIIFSSNGWTQDGVRGYVCNMKTGEIVEQLPQFSELFPGWDMPELTTGSLDEQSQMTVITKEIDVSQ